MKKAIIHIGTHKTGTSSFQEYLNINKKKLEDYNIYVYPSSPHDLHLATIRDSLPTPPVMEAGNFDKDGLFHCTRAAIKEFIQNKDEGIFLFSNEHISYMRTDSEFARFRSLFPNEIDVVCILVLREKNDFLKSYKAQIIKTGHGVSDDPSSPYYVEPESWLVDYDTLQEKSRQYFDNVIVLQYQRSGMVSALLEILGVHHKGVDNTYRGNVRPLISKEFESAAKNVVDWLNLRGPATRCYRFIRRYI